MRSLKQIKAADEQLDAYGSRMIPFSRTERDELVRNYETAFEACRNDWPMFQLADELKLSLLWPKKEADE